jgi:hypothetical protein
VLLVLLLSCTVISEPPDIGCYGLKSFSTFAFTAASILISGGQGRLKPSARQFLRRINAEFAADADFAGGMVQNISCAFREKGIASHVESLQRFIAPLSGTMQF